MPLGILHLIKNDRNNIGLPNLLTASRLLFLPFIVHFLSWGTAKGDGLAVLFMFFSGLTDFLDGYVARHMNMRSHLGRMLDPLVDKISVGVAMLAIAAYKGLPYWYVLIVICRDIIILSSSVYAISKKQVIFESNTLGKWTVTSFLAVIVFYTLNLFPFNRIVMFISLVLIPFSLVKYLSRYRVIFPKTLMSAFDNEDK